jgi:hypothetical protein
VSLQLVYDIEDVLKQNAASKALVSHTVEWEASQTTVRQENKNKYKRRFKSIAIPHGGVGGLNPKA